VTIAYFDCFSGSSGDMILGALLDAGLPLAHLKRRLALVEMGEFKLELKRDGDFGGANLKVITKEEPASTDYAGLDSAIAGSKLHKAERETARAILRRLASAEAAVHGRPIEQVHFHEVGATDSLVDIVGAAIGVHHFGFKEIHCSPLPMSRGSVTCRHGTLPVPAPATLELLKGVPLERTDVKGEMVTPTGAAILTEICVHFGSCPLQAVDRVGTGFGDRRIKGRPNMLRLLVGEGFAAVAIETDIDDMNPELFDPVVSKLFRAGAVDVTLGHVQMKKNRPGVRLGCIAPWDLRDRIIDVILEETTTFGVRYWPAERKVLLREFKKEKVRKGEMNFKIGRDASGKIVKAMPEFEDVMKLARKNRRPVGELYAEAMAASRKLISKKTR
jgi:uncharacterized protein (TIGR00299 family) protein